MCGLLSVIKYSECMNTLGIKGHVSHIKNHFHFTLCKLMYPFNLQKFKIFAETICVVYNMSGIIVDILDLVLFLSVIYKIFI